MLKIIKLNFLTVYFLKNNCDIVDYHRNKLTLNMAGNFIKVAYRYLHGSAVVLKNLLMCDLLMHAQTFGILPILKLLLKKWDIEFLKELYQKQTAKT